MLAHMRDIDQAQNMPATEIVDGRCIVTFAEMPSWPAFEAIIEVTEQAVHQFNPGMEIEVRLPDPGE